MKIIIDTQSLIWLAENNPNLSAKARQAIENTANQCFVSLASFWEMSIKMNLGKLAVKGLSLSEFMQEIDETTVQTLGISKAHILQNGTLPFHHRDPFDRLIISQSLVENMQIVSNDEAFDAYGITRIW